MIKNYKIGDVTKFTKTLEEISIIEIEKSKIYGKIIKVSKANG